jgi:hypothetical protein
MHGREKSDSAIVAGKPTNKAVSTAAEPVERRAEAKGNASQQSYGSVRGALSNERPYRDLRNVVANYPFETLLHLRRNNRIPDMETTRV